MEAVSPFMGHGPVATISGEVDRPNAGEVSRRRALRLVSQVRELHSQFPTETHALVWCSYGRSQVLKGVKRRRDDPVTLLLVDPPLFPETDTLKSERGLKIFRPFQFNTLSVIRQAGTHHCLVSPAFVDVDLRQQNIVFVSDQVVPRICQEGIKLLAGSSQQV